MKIRESHLKNGILSLLFTNLIWYENENARILFHMYITENNIHAMNLNVGLGDPDDDDIKPITE